MSFSNPSDTIYFEKLKLQKFYRNDCYANHFAPNRLILDRPNLSHVSSSPEKSFCLWVRSVKFGQVGHTLMIHGSNSSSSGSNSKFIPIRKQSTSYMSKDTISVNEDKLSLLLVVTTKAEGSSCWQPKEWPWSVMIGCPIVQLTKFMDSWTPGSDPRNPPTGTVSTSGPGNHKPRERTHWSIIRCRYTLTTGSHKA